MRSLKALTTFSLCLITVSFSGANVANSCGWGGESDGDDEIIMLEIGADGEPLTDNLSMITSPKLQNETGNQFREDANYEQALIWYKKAAEQGNKEAQNNLAGLYEFGLGLPQDFTKAIHWYRLAATTGEPHAQHSLGVIYAEGKGVEKNVGMAHLWLVKAADQKHLKAFADMAKIMEQGPEKLKWLMLAVHHGDSDANPALKAARAQCTKDDINKSEELFSQWLADRG
ncbi:MAG: sel1 repeat family protein [Rhodospirillales bacterium]|jgi:TPR repeat protein|nr:sel1 repeat family protein [Rhodospirillales bacterium]